MRRASDRHAVRDSVAGTVVVALGVWLHTHGGFSEAGSLTLIILGAGIFRSEKLTELLRARWSGTAETEIQTRRKQGEEDGVEPT